MYLDPTLQKWNPILTLICSPIFGLQPGRVLARRVLLMSQIQVWLIFKFLSHAHFIDALMAYTAERSENSASP